MLRTRSRAAVRQSRSSCTWRLLGLRGTRPSTVTARPVAVPVLFATRFVASGCGRKQLSARRPASQSNSAGPFLSSRRLNVRHVAASCAAPADQRSGTSCTEPARSCRRLLHSLARKLSFRWKPRWKPAAWKPRRRAFDGGLPNRLGPRTYRRPSGQSLPCVVRCVPASRPAFGASLTACLPVFRAPRGGRFPFVPRLVPAARTSSARERSRQRPAQPPPLPRPLPDELPPSVRPIAAPFGAWPAAVTAPLDPREGEAAVTPALPVEAVTIPRP